MSRSPFNVFACALMACAATLLSSCSLVFDFAECSADADCQRFESPGTFYTCNTTLNTCQVDETVVCRGDGDCAMGEVCDANACVAGMSDDMGVDMEDMGEDMTEGTACERTSECIAALGDSFGCGSDGVCVDLLGPDGDCLEVHYTNNADPDSAVYFAALLPLVEPFGSALGNPLRNAVQLAVDEFNTSGGLGGRRQNVALIVCDTKGNAGVATRAAQHLVDTVGVQSVIGPVFSQPFIQVVSSVTNPADVLAFQPGGTSPALDSLFEPKKLMWRNIPSDIFQGAATVQQSQNTGLPKVLILHKDDRYGNDLRQETALPLITDLGDANVKVRSYPDPVNVMDPSVEGLQREYGMVLADVMTPEPTDPGTWFIPDIVYIVGTSEGAIMGGVYVSFTSATLMQPLASRVIFSHGAVPSISTLAKQIPEQIHPIVRGIAPAIFDPTSPAYLGYRISYNTKFNNTEPALASTTSFDGAMTILFAMAAVPEGQELTGPNIAAQIPRLNDKGGRQIDFFATGWVANAVGELSSGGTIDMVGVSSQLDFDENTGQVYTPFVTYGIAPIPNSEDFTIAPLEVLVFPNAPETTGASWMMIPE